MTRPTGIFSVKEKLPNVLEKVLVYKDGKRSEAYLCACKCVCWATSCTISAGGILSEDYIEDITHWAYFTEEQEMEISND